MIIEKLTVAENCRRRVECADCFVLWRPAARRGGGAVRFTLNFLAASRAAGRRGARHAAGSHGTVMRSINKAPAARKRLPRAKGSLMLELSPAAAWARAPSRCDRRGALWLDATASSTLSREPSNSSSARAPLAQSASILRLSFCQTTAALCSTVWAWSANCLSSSICGRTHSEMIAC